MPARDVEHLMRSLAIKVCGVKSELADTKDKLASAEVELAALATENRALLAENQRLRDDFRRRIDIAASCSYDQCVRTVDLKKRVAELESQLKELKVHAEDSS